MNGESKPERRVFTVGVPVVDMTPNSPTDGKVVSWTRFWTCDEAKATAERDAGPDRTLQSFSESEVERLPVKSRLHALNTLAAAAAMG